MFVHGLHQTPRCWQPWIRRLEDRGCTCFAPAWPGRYGPVEMLRRTAGEGPLSRLRLADIVDEYYKLMLRIDEPVAFVGHGLGGLVALLLLQRGLVSAAVAICPTSPAGLVSWRWSYWRARWPILTPWRLPRRPLQMTRRQFAWAYAGQLPDQARHALYEAEVVPDSLRVARDALTGAARIDYSRPHAPLLLVAGGRDRVCPPALARALERRYATSRPAAAGAAPPSIVDLKVYPERSHGILAEPGWEAVADDILAWTETRTADAPG